MENFTLNKLWDLRAELDKAIISKDYEAIKSIRAKYLDLVDGKWEQERVFTCYYHAFWNDGQRRSHRFSNFNAILANIENYEKKYINGEDVSVKLKVHDGHFLAGEIWTLRAMYDKFLMQGRKPLEELPTQQNMILGKAVLDRLMTLMKIEPIECYYSEIKPLLYEVQEGYKNTYGDRKPRLDYNQIAEEFLER